MSRILFTPFLGNELKMFPKKILAVRPEKEKRMAIVKLFEFHTNAIKLQAYSLQLY